jgi:hypothetical protein
LPHDKGIISDSNDSIFFRTDTERFVQQLYRKFLANIIAGVESTHRANVNFSKKEFVDALKEAETDISFIKNRRALHSGISESKLAGVLLFRLCRRKIIHLCHRACEIPHYHTLQERAAINTVLELMHLDINQDWINQQINKARPSPSKTKLQDLGRELVFIIKSRHYNQESLAIFFDALCYIDFAANQIFVQTRSHGLLLPPRQSD